MENCTNCGKESFSLIWIQKNNEGTNCLDAKYEKLCPQCYLIRFGLNTTLSPSVYGWVCPRCGKVHSPYSIECNCTPLVNTFSSPTTDNK